MARKITSFAMSFETTLPLSKRIPFPKVSQTLIYHGIKLALFTFLNLTIVVCYAGCREGMTRLKFGRVSFFRRGRRRRRVFIFLHGSRKYGNED